MVIFFFLALLRAAIEVSVNQYLERGATYLALLQLQRAVNRYLLVSVVVAGGILALVAVTRWLARRFESTARVASRILTGWAALWIAIGFVLALALLTYEFEPIVVNSLSGALEPFARCVGEPFRLPL